jgi:hypothetical protein
MVKQCFVTLKNECISKNKMANYLQFGIIFFGSFVKRLFQITFVSIQVTFHEEIKWKHDDVMQVLHLKKQIITYNSLPALLGSANRDAIQKLLGKIM